MESLVKNLDYQNTYFTFLCFYPLCFYYSKALWKYLSTYTFGNRFLSAFCIEIGFFPEDSWNLDFYAIEY